MITNITSLEVYIRLKNSAIVVPTVAQEVYKAIRNQIIRGEFAPGQKLSIRKLAELYGVSTMPVREALSKLESEGFVQFDRRSIIVNQLSTKELIEIFAIRKLLEKQAIEWATPNIRPSDLVLLENIIKEMDENIHSPFEWRRLNKTFHFELYSHAHSKPLSELLHQLWGRVESYMNIYSSSEHLSSAQAEHYKMLELIKEEQLDDLTSLILEHIQITCDAIIEEMAKLE